MRDPLTLLKEAHFHTDLLLAEVQRLRALEKELPALLRAERIRGRREGLAAASGYIGHGDGCSALDRGNGICDCDCMRAEFDAIDPESW